MTMDDDNRDDDDGLRLEASYTVVDRGTQHGTIGHEANHREDWLHRPTPKRRWTSKRGREVMDDDA